MRFHVVNLGCKVNRVESDDAAAQLIASGWSAADEADADLIVVNTCTVTGEADKKTRKAVRHAVRANDRARIVVTGCAAAIDPDAFRSMSDRVAIVPKSLLGASIARIGASVEAKGELRAAATGGALRLGDAFPTRVGIKVQDGCDHACTYCIVHVARGRAASVSSDDVVREAVAYARAGVKEIVLTGINLGSYRSGAGDECIRLADLLELLLRASARACEDTPARAGEPLPRFRLSSIEPMDVDDELINALANAGGRICRHVHIPLQAGSSKVLRDMARPYDSLEYMDLVERLRGSVPSIALTTDVIAGFPGETDEEFAETIALCRAAGFSKMHVFPYSRRAGTPAAERTDQVSPETKRIRTAQLRALSDELRASDRRARSGSEELALVESEGCATTESYYEVSAPPGSAVGDLVPVRLP